MYDARDVANLILDLATKKSLSLTNMSVNKLVYFSCGFYSADYNQRLVSDDFQAWEFGPVIPKLFHSFKKFGAEAITEKAKRFNPVTRSYYYVHYSIDECATNYVSYVLEAYGQLSAYELSDLSHAPDGPWSRVFKAEGGFTYPNSVIPVGMIHNYFVDFKRKSKN